MYYYQHNSRALCSFEPNLPFEKLNRLPDTGTIAFLFRRPPLTGRDAFAVTHPRLLTAEESMAALTDAADALEIPPALAEAVAEGRVTAANLDHPRWEALLTSPLPQGKKRVNLLALGDVGSTLLIGLKLLGGESISHLGICDVREEAAKRWEFELNQIAPPMAYDALPPVEIVPQEALFDCDVFLFCASRFVPDTAVKSGDVRMAQYALNRELVVSYARQARQAGYGGLFCVVSDPVDPLCRAALLRSNEDENGVFDGRGLLTHQVRGFGLGVMNARAAYYAKKDPRLASFLTEGRSFGPHGQGLTVANSIARYDDALSQELTAKTLRANLEMRELGFKPYVAPALSSGALSILAAIEGRWHYSSGYLDGVFMGCHSCLTPAGPAVEQLPLPGALLRRIEEAAAVLRAIEA